MSKNTLTERVKKLEERASTTSLPLSEKQHKCLEYISLSIDCECRDYAIKQLTEASDWISVIDAKKINKDYKSEGIMVRNDNSMSVPTPNGKDKYDKNYFYKLEEIVFSEEKNNLNFIKRFLNKIKNKK